MYRHLYLSIDPGTKMLGTTVNAITMDNQWVVLHTCTTDIELLVKHRFPSGLVDIHGERFFKNMACGQVIQKFAESWMVGNIVSESPYMGKFAQAFAALTECLTSIRNASYAYNPNLPLYSIDPSSIKKCVGVPGNSGNKDLMKEAVRKIAGSMVAVDLLDEHAIDSMAVGYAWYRTVWLGLPM